MTVKICFPVSHGSSRVPICFYYYLSKVVSNLHNFLNPPTLLLLSSCLLTGRFYLPLHKGNRTSNRNTINNPCALFICYFFLSLFMYIFITFLLRRQGAPTSIKLTPSSETLLTQMQHSQEYLSLSP